jgi:hypothetical protein
MAITVVHPGRAWMLMKYPTLIQAATAAKLKREGATIPYFAKLASVGSFRSLWRARFAALECAPGGGQNHARV